MYTKVEKHKISDCAQKAKLIRSDSIESLETSDNAKKQSKNSWCNFSKNYETSEFEEVWDSAPETNDFKVIFPWHKETKEYSTINFHPMMAQNMVSYIELGNMMESIKSVKYYSVQSLIRWQVLLRNILFLIPLLTFALIGFF